MHLQERIMQLIFMVILHVFSYFLQKFNNKSFFFDLQEKNAKRVKHHFRIDIDDCIDIKLWNVTINSVQLNSHWK